MVSRKDKNAARLKRHIRVRAKISGTADRPRLAVYRSENNISAQIIDDVNGKTLVAAGTLDADIKAQAAYGGNKAAAKLVGEKVGKLAKEAGIDTVCFDRGGYLYHGRVQELADGARAAGLEF